MTTQEKMQKFIFFDTGELINNTDLHQLAEVIHSLCDACHHCVNKPKCNRISPEYIPIEINEKSYCLDGIIEYFRGHKVKILF